MTTEAELRALLAEALPYIKAKAEQDHEFMGHKINTEVLPAARLVSSITAALAEKDGGWVSVSERLPEQGVSVLVYEPGRHVQKTCRDEYDWMLPHKSNVTHWQPLPPLPTERKV